MEVPKGPLIDKIAGSDTAIPPDGSDPIHVARLLVLPIMVEHGLAMGKLDSNDVMDPMMNYHLLMGFYGEVMSYRYSSRTGISGIIVTKPGMSLPNDKNVDINKSGVKLLHLREDKDESIFVRGVAKRVDNLREMHLADWYKTHPDDDPTNLLKSPVQGFPAGEINNYPVNQGPDNTVSVIALDVTCGFPFIHWRNR
eukprot:13514844-Ditylum_brightwellii.AAC.2